MLRLAILTVFAFLAVSSANKYDYRGSYGDSLTICCWKGESQARMVFDRCIYQDTKIINVFNHDKKFRDACKQTFLRCCEDKVREQKCEDGKQVAIESLLPVDCSKFEENSIQRSCCESCGAGLDQGEAYRNRTFDCHDVPNVSHAPSYSSCCKSTRKCLKCFDEENRVCDTKTGECRCKRGYNLVGDRCHSKRSTPTPPITTSGTTTTEPTTTTEITTTTEPTTTTTVKPIPECDKGYAYNNESDKCEDINECEEGDKCVLPNTFCVNKPGGWYCEEEAIPCGAGETQVKGVCQDVDECKGEHGCQHKCLNTIGSYECLCDEGYALAYNGKSCKNVNECATGKHDCKGICVDKTPGFECKCPKQFMYVKETKSCKAFSFCNSNKGTCKPEEICIDVYGADHRCKSAHCPKNYVEDTVKGRCRKNCSSCDGPPLLSFVNTPLVSNAKPRSLYTIPATSKSKKKFAMEIANVSDSFYRRYFIVKTANNQLSLELRSGLKGPKDVTVDVDIKDYKGDVIHRCEISLYISRWDGVRFNN